MGFKFLDNNIPDEPIGMTDEELNELNLEINRLSVHNRPAVFLSLHRNRNTIDDNEWNFILERQRKNLIEYMWEQGMIVQTIVSQDIDGFTLRTEINF